MYLRVYDSRDSSRQTAPSPFLHYSLTHENKSIGYHNHNPKPLTDSVTRLMYLRVYDSRDISHQTPPSPFLYYSLTHAHWSIGYRNRNPQPLTESTARLMYLRVYDNRSHTLRYFGFLNIWPGLQFPATWPLGLVLLYVYQNNPVYVRCFRSFGFSV
jgi:hypothetical protein